MRASLWVQEQIDAVRPGFLFMLGSRFVLVFALVSFLLYYAYTQFGYPRIGIDDANIFMAYAQNVADGHGFVYNAGGERVEGFSSFLYLLVLSALYVVSDTPERLALFFSGFVVAAAVGAVVAVFDSAHYQAGKRAPGFAIVTAGGLLVIAWTFSSPAYITWTTLTLMDTGLWSALLLVSGLSVICATPDRSHLVSAVTLLMPALLVLARPEGMFWAPVFVGLHAVLHFNRHGNLRQAVGAALPYLVVYSLSVGALVGSRLLYFGVPFPNTYYAKVSPDWRYNLGEGFDYLAEFVSSSPLVILVVACLALYLPLVILDIVRKKRLEPVEQFGLIFAVVATVGLVVPVLVGGDHFRWFRFYQPIWPALIIPGYVLGRRLFNRLEGSLPARSGIVVTLLAASVLFQMARPSWFDFSTPNIQEEFWIANGGRLVGELLNRLFAGSDLPSIGVVPAGGIAVEYDGEIVDLLGLNNPEMAQHPGDRHGVKNHAAFNKEVFFRQVPQIVAPKLADSLVPAHPYEGGWQERALKGLFTDERFVALYSVSAIELAGTNVKGFLVAAVRNDYLAYLQQQNRFTVHVFEEGTALENDSGSVAGWVPLVKAESN